MNKNLLRALLAAHAPHEVPGWFSPVLPPAPPRPPLPAVSSAVAGFDKVLQREMEQHLDTVTRATTQDDFCNVPTFRIGSDLAAYGRMSKLQVKLLEDEVNKISDSYVARLDKDAVERACISQWPWAYADLVIAGQHAKSNEKLDSNTPAGVR